MRKTRLNPALPQKQPQQPVRPQLIRRITAHTIRAPKAISSTPDKGCSLLAFIPMQRPILVAEIGISTDRLHARSPMGLNELCSYKYLVTGTGQVRA